MRRLIAAVLLLPVACSEPLQAGWQINGRVVDGATGKPVQKYEVRIETPDRVHTYQPQQNVMISLGHFVGSVPVSEAAGRFSITPPAKERVALTIMAPGFLSRTIGPFEPGVADASDVSLEPSYTISGRVLDSNGAPVPDARIGFHSPAEDMPARRPPVMMEPIRAGADGRYTLPDLDRGAFVVEVARRGYVPRTVEVRADASGTLDFVLERAASIEGRVTDAGGKPLAGVTVSATPPAATPMPAEWLRSTTDASGRFRIDSIIPGVYTVAAAGANMTHPAVSRSLRDGDLVDFVLEPAGTITCTFEGDLPPRFVAHAVSSTGSADAPIENGRATFEGLAPGRYEVFAQFEYELTRLRTASTFVDVQAGTNATCSVAVGGPLVVNVLTKQPSDYNWLWLESRDVVTRAKQRLDPNLTIAGLQPARYRLEMTVHGVKYETEVDVVPGLRLTYDLRQTGTMKFDVFDSESGDELDANILLTQTGGVQPRVMPWQRRGVDNEFWGLQPGRYEAKIEVPNYRTVSLTMESPQPDVSVPLTRLPARYDCDGRAAVAPPIASRDAEPITEALEWYIAKSPRIRDRKVRRGFSPRLYFLVADTTIPFSTSDEAMYPNDPADDVATDEQRALIGLMNTTVWKNIAKVAARQSLAPLPSSEHYELFCSERKLSKEFPTAVGLLQVTAPSYSNDGQKALVHVREDEETGVVVLLAREGSHWAVRWGADVLPSGY